MTHDVRACPYAAVWWCFAHGSAGVLACDCFAAEIPLASSALVADDDEGGQVARCHAMVLGLCVNLMHVETVRRFSRVPTLVPVVVRHTACGQVRDWVGHEVGDNRFGLTLTRWRYNSCVFAYFEETRVCVQPRAAYARVREEEPRLVVDFLDIVVELRVGCKVADVVEELLQPSVRRSHQNALQFRAWLQ